MSATARLLDPLNYDVGRQLHRLHDNPPPDPDDEESWAWAAVVILANPTVHDGLVAAVKLARVDRLHQPVPWSGSDSDLICYSCRTAFPCASRQAIDGEPDQ